MDQQRDGIWRAPLSEGETRGLRAATGQGYLAAGMLARGGRQFADKGPSSWGGSRCFQGKN